MLEDFVSLFSKGFFCTLNQTWHTLALHRWRTHKLICLLFLTLGSKMQREYSKSTSAHTCFASVPSNNLQLSSYMTLLGGRFCQFESLRQRRELDPECLFPGECLHVCGHCTSPQLQGRESSHNIFVRLCQPVSDPTETWETNAFFSHLHQV